MTRVPGLRPSTNLWKGFMEQALATPHVPIMPVMPQELSVQPDSVPQEFIPEEDSPPDAI